MSILQESILAFTVQDRKPTSISVVLSTLLSIAAVLLAIFVSAEAGRIAVLRSVLVLIAFGELMGSIGQGLFTRPLFERQGRPFHPLHRDAIQDFSFYNLAMALGLMLAALHPLKNSVIIDVYIFLSLIHGTAHVVRFFRGTHPDRGAELRQGLPLLVAVLALVLFHP